jgi:hypothetical protein
MTQPAPSSHPHTAISLAAAILLGAAIVPGAIAAVPHGASLATRASLAQPGWIPADERRFTTTNNSFPGWDGAIRSEWRYRPGTYDEITFGGGYSRSLRTARGQFFHLAQHGGTGSVLPPCTHSTGSAQHFAGTRIA